MLVAIIISSVIMLGAGMLYQSALVGYNVSRDVRDNLYTANLTSDRITESLRRANPMAVLVRVDPVNAQNNVIVYNYGKSLYRNPVTTWSGIVYAYNERLYVYDNQIGSDSTAPLGDVFTDIPLTKNFSTISDTDLRNWMSTPAADPDGPRNSEIIGYGVRRFRANRNTATWSSGPGGLACTPVTTWTVEYLEAGR
jgi:hypothetical protein